MFNKMVFFIVIFTFSSFQNSKIKEIYYQKIDALRLEVLKKNIIGKIYEFNLTGKKECNKSKLKYLGIIKTLKNKSYKLLNSFYVFGTSCRGNSSLYIYDLKNKYQGNYYLEMPVNLPDTIINNEIVYSKNQDNYMKRKGTKISFKNGLPNQIHLAFYKNTFHFSK